MISAFLNHLETERHNSTRTRNVRLTAIRSLFTYAALRHPEHALAIQRVLAIPPKGFDKRIITFLTPAEIDALVAAPDQSRWEGRRDRALMLMAIQTGLRVSELTGLNCADVTLGTGASVRCDGKGRKQRAVPLSAPVAALLQAWLRERAGRPEDLCPSNRRGRVVGIVAVSAQVELCGHPHSSTSSATSRYRLRRRTIPSWLPATPEDLDRADHEPWNRQLGQRPGRRNGRRRDARPAPGPQRRHAPGRRQLPAPLTPRPRRPTTKGGTATTLNREPHHRTRWGSSTSNPAEFQRAASEVRRAAPNESIQSAKNRH